MFKMVPMNLMKVPGESGFTARAKTPTSNEFKILKKFRNDCISLQNNLQKFQNF
jgi:hypothetical protein